MSGLFSPNDPKWASSSRSFTGFVQYDGQVPFLLATLGAGWVGYQDFSILHTPEHNEMPACNKVAGGHDGYHQFPAAERVYDTLRFAGPAALPPHHRYHLLPRL